MSHGPPAPEERGLPDAGVTTEPQQPQTPPHTILSSESQSPELGFSCCPDTHLPICPSRCDHIRQHQAHMPSWTVQEFGLLHFIPLLFMSSWHPPPLQTSFVGPSLSPMQLDGGLHCQGFGSSINRLRGRATLASNVALSVSSPYPVLFLSVTAVAAATPTGKKKKKKQGGWGRGGGCNGGCPSFSRL